TGPGHRLQGRTLIIGRAAIAFPATDRQHEFDARPVGHLSETDAIRPIAGPALRHHRDRPAGGAVGAEQTELESVVAAHRGARPGPSFLLAGSANLGSYNICAHRNGVHHVQGPDATLAHGYPTKPLPRRRRSPNKVVDLALKCPPVEV